MRHQLKLVKSTVKRSSYNETVYRKATVTCTLQDKLRQTEFIATNRFEKFNTLQTVQVIENNNVC